jgi:cell wall-associated NlpC family hydrolase
MKSWFRPGKIFVILTCCGTLTSDASVDFAMRDSLVDTLVRAETPMVDSLLQFALTYIGTPYQYGSTSSRTFDCSGFVCHCYGKFGIELPHGSAAQSKVGDPVSLEEVQKGDLLFFNGRTAGGKKIGHVSIVLSNENGIVRMIHATHRGVVIDEYPDSAYYKKRYVAACRIIQ